MAMLEMQGSEIKSLRKIISGLYEFKKNVRRRERLIDEAGLSTILTEVKLDDEAGQVAWEIIYRLRRFNGTLPNKPKVLALGALLRNVLETPDLPQDEARTIVVLMLKYKLVQDAAYLRPLKDRFNISDADLQPAKPNFVRPMVDQHQIAELEKDDTEITRLGRIISGLYEFKKSAAGRTKLIDEAGLSTILAEVKLDDEAGQVAWEIIYRLRRYGAMPNEPHVHALGALLRDVLETPDLPQDEARIIVVLMLKYNLIQDAAYLRPLKDRFNISDADLQPTKPNFVSLTVSQRQQLHQALMSAFPPHGSLSHMINLRFHEILEEITEIGSLEDMIQDLIEWSEANGRTEELLRKARAHNPTDPLLTAVCQEIL